MLIRRDRRRRGLIGRRFWGTPLPFDVSPGTAADLRVLSSEPGELLLVDSPPGTAATIDAAIDAADLVIIPTGPRAADIDRVWPTLDITQHRPTTILLTLVDMRKLEAVEMPRALAEANAPVLRSIVRDLTAIERAFGRGMPQHLGDYGDVFDELMAAEGINGERPRQYDGEAFGGRRGAGRGDPPAYRGRGDHAGGEYIAR